MMTDTGGDRWGSTDVAVTLTGEEWTALLARTLRQEMSPLGAKIYNRAAGKLQAQLLASSKAFKDSQS